MEMPLLQLEPRPYDDGSARSRPTNALKRTTDQVVKRRPWLEVSEALRQTLARQAGWDA